MSGKTRKFAQLSPQKQRQSPAKFVKLTEHDDSEERRERTASKIAKGHERARSIVHASSTRRASGIHGSPSTPLRNGAFDATLPASPAMKMPILANFEEWMKMATDNKINAGNSWNFALIDYFHEMSLLKEGDSINFQKASVTLDGCVKIYTNRVDSVATETGKLLSGLSSNKEARSSGADGTDEDGDGADEDDEDVENRKVRKKATKTSSGSTLVKDFSAIQAKKLDMEFFVDPLFKKTSAEFDEGGAKGLLLNHLCVDREGRIIFDASDASNEVTATEAAAESAEEEHEVEIDTDALGAKFFPELFEDDEDQFDRLHICPALKDFQSDSNVLDIPLLANFNTSLNVDNVDNTILHDDVFNGVDDDDNAGMDQPGLIDVFDENEHAVFGEVDLNLPTRNLLDHNLQSPNTSRSYDATGQGTAVGSEHFLSFNGDSEAMYMRFDELMKKNWTGPANWKITRLNANVSTNAAAVKRPRKEKEVTTIDFLSSEGEVDQDTIFAPGGTSINLPKTQWSSKTRNLLPEDKHFNSESLLRLFLKPAMKIGSRKTIVKAEDGTANGRFIDMDENFWAQRNEESAAPDADGGYDANFFQDGENLVGPGAADDEDDDDDDAFEDARQEFPIEPASDFGSQLQTMGRKVKPEYVNYAKAAKKVDVRVLKENIWDKLELLSVEDTDADEGAADRGKEQEAQPPPPPGQEGPQVRKFTEIVQSLGDVYPAAAMSEISTSFCFICLLHLANEKGLEITGEEGMKDLSVKRDETVLSIESV
ncbi:Condensin complex subunit 2 [Taphrina deformans PYCC 5710]|uniref:Condensin complex subunit 2 n=1 Tax=Taphrina deformans (strain PYCC 5710 / ATCC 11124 / CBS 356.35 / IMI 108563 / JCM 9778 / NBRC 8474) TaxID=1097556 RepID=R5A386_TAPDE|nr:Condensin complex subunit 2 [Taphrina deformans PYCC 5710]|eukprot:CCX35405.1 Condensin complex subunit 2 [Taphrina deformans PYCC 5710]